MLDVLEPSLRLLFFILSFVWAGRIMILRTDKQIIINPLLIIISSALLMLPTSNEEILGISVNTIKVILYILYIFIIVFGLLSTNKKDSFFK